MPNWLHKCSHTCWLTHAHWKWFLHLQPALQLALEGYLVPLLSWKRETEWGECGGRMVGFDWVEKNNRELRKLSGQGRVSLPSDSRSESSSSWNPCSWGRQSRAEPSSRLEWWALLYRTGQTSSTYTYQLQIYTATHYFNSTGGGFQILK